ncbi:hypothetical protein ACFE04_003681 [Oxalis oulophora]
MDSSGSWRKMDSSGSWRKMDSYVGFVEGEGNCRDRIFSVRRISRIPNILSRGLTRENYATFFSVLLDMEEMHLKEDPRSHSMKSISTKMKRLSKMCVVKIILGCKGAPPYLIYGPPRTDDVVQVLELESRIPISYFCLKKMVVVIAGDPMQLELIASKDYDRSSFINSVSFLPDKEFPIRFYGIQGCEESGGSIPSLFNRIEASKVIEFIQELLGGVKLTKKDIRVIALFQVQTQVIIISTVSSTVKLNEIDRGHYFGILINPRAFNVAVTHSRALLIIIGNPHIICKPVTIAHVDGYDIFLLLFNSLLQFLMLIVTPVITADVDGYLTSV